MNTDKKVVFATPFFNYGGFEKSLLRIATYLKEEGFSVSLILTWQDNTDFILKKEVEKCFDNVIYLDKPNRFFKNLHALRLLYYLRDIQSVISIYDPFCAAVSGMFRNKRFIALVRNDHPLSYQRSISQIKWFDFISGNSTRILDQFKSRVEENYHYKLRYLPNGVKHFVENVNYDDKLTLNFLFVGRLVNESKNIFILPQISFLLKQSGVKHKISVIGDGIDKEILQENCVSSGVRDNFQFLGYKSNSEVLELMRASKFLLFTSNYEGLPNVLLESMSQGLIPISVRLPGITDTIIDDKRNGFLVDNNPESFVKTIKEVEKLSSLELKTLSQNCVLKIKNEFSQKAEKSIVLEMVTSPITKKIFLKKFPSQSLVNSMFYRCCKFIFGLKTY